MRYLFKGGLVLALLILAAFLAMFFSSIWTGDSYAPVINLLQFILVVMTVILALLLFSRLGKGTIVRRLWGLVSLAMSVVLAGAFCEMINGFAGEWKVPQDIVLLIYLVVWLILICYPFTIYRAFRRTGLPLDWRAISKVLPRRGDQDIQLRGDNRHPDHHHHPDHHGGRFNAGVGAGQLLPAPGIRFPDSR